MSTEGPMIRDGSQTVAAADYSNTAALAGQGGSAQFFCVALSQSADRTSVLASSIGQQIYGVLQNKPKAGQAADVAILGITKVQVGAGNSTRGKPQMVIAAGTVTDWTAGSGYSQIGVALESGTVGQIIAMALGSDPKVLT